MMFLLAAKWHPQHERLLATGGSDGSMMFWLTGYVISHRGLSQ